MRFLLDELRDYAYFGRDGVHPNELAVDYIWEKFKSAYFTEETLKINQEFLQIQQLFRHKPLHEFSEETRDFIKKREAMKEEFLQKYPYFKTTNFLK